MLTNLLIFILIISTNLIECSFTKPMVSKVNNETVFVNATLNQRGTDKHGEDVNKKVSNDSVHVDKGESNTAILQTEATEDHESKTTIEQNKLVNGIPLQHPPYQLGTLDQDTINKTAQLIELINKIDIKQIVPLIVGSGPKKKVYPGRIRRSYRKRRPYGNFLKVPPVPPSYVRSRTTPKLVNRPRERKSYWLATEDQRVRSLGLIKKRGNFDTRRINDDQPLVFLLQPNLKLYEYPEERRHFLRNPEVIEEYINNRRSSRRRKKHQSTSSSSDDDDDIFRRGDARRMSNPGTEEENDEAEVRAKSGEEVMDKGNYDDRLADYVMTTKKGVWDYEHENWAEINKRIDSKKESEGDSREGKAGYNRESNRHKGKDHQSMLKNIDEEHKKFEDKKHKSVGDIDAVAKVESILKDTGVGVSSVKKKMEVYPESRSTRQSHESELERTTRKEYSKEKKYDDWSREKEKMRPEPSHQSLERQEESNKNNHRIKNEEDEERKIYKHRIEKETYDERNHRNEHESPKRKKDEFASREEKRRVDNGKPRHDYVDVTHNDYYPKKQERYNSGSRERPNSHHNRGNSKENNRNIRYSNERVDKHKRIEKGDISRNVEHRNSNKDYEKRSPERDALRSRENEEFLDRKRYKKSQQRHVESVSNWGNGKSVDWGHRSNEDLRSNKKGWTQNWNKEVDVSKNNENYNVNKHKSNPKNSNAKEKINPKNKSDREDFWNRHAHNDWSKVGVDYGKKKVYSAPKPERFAQPVRTTGKNDIFDRHAHNQWDRVGKHVDYKDKVSFESKPQSHRSQDSGDSVFFGYVHTSLPFKGKETVFDDK